MEGRTMKGLIECAAFIQYDMDKTPPIVPVKTRNLQSSWFVTRFHTANKEPGLMMGFSANYAWYVHEMIGESKKINWSRPGSGPKFFEAALKRNRDKLLSIIQSNAKVT